MIIDGWGSDECVSEENLGYRTFIWEIGKPKPKPYDDCGMANYEKILEATLFEALQKLPDIY